MIKRITQKFMQSAALAMGAAFLAASPLPAQASTRGVYVGNEFYAPTTTWQNNARNSGFTTLFLFTLHVEANGDIRYNDTMVVQNGVYIGDATWKAKLAACKVAPTSVTRIEAALGCWGDPSFTNIKNLIAAQGTGTGSILYKNFLAFKNATGVDAIQYDDELTYDATSAVAFGNMLAGQGLKVTLCPYTAQSFWVSVKAQLGSKVDAIYLQCYDGGAGNDPANWINAFGGFKVMPGLWGNTDTTNSAAIKFRNWQLATGITGGFMWLNGSLPGDAPKWAQAVKSGLDPVNLNNGTYALYARHSNKALAAKAGGTANLTPLVQYAYSGANSMRWTLTSLGNGQYNLIGVASGRSINVANGATTNNAPVVLYDWRNENNAKVTLTATDSGYFIPVFVHSGRALTVYAASTGDNANVIQYFNNGGNNAQWQFRNP